MPVKKKAVAKTSTAKKPAKKKVGHERSEIRKQAAAIRDVLNDAQPDAGVRLLDDSESVVYDGACLDTGIPALNKLLTGREDGGFPRGRIVEFRGKPSSAKTSTAMKALAIAQGKGEIGALVDAEHALDRQLARKLGVKLSELVYQQPRTGEIGLKLVRNIAKAEAASIVIIDSIAALKPEVEDGDNYNDARPGTHAKMMSVWSRRIQSELSDEGPCVIFINQLRTNPMVMFGSKDTSPGGAAMEYYASIRVDVRRIKTHFKTKGKKKVNLGFRIMLKTIKNRCTKPFQELELDVWFDKGVLPVPKTKLKEVRDE